MSMFWVLFVRKYSKLTKFIQKIDHHLRMARIFMDSVDKSAFYMFSRNILLILKNFKNSNKRLNLICYRALCIILKVNFRLVYNFFLLRGQI